MKKKKKIKPEIPVFEMQKAILLERIPLAGMSILWELFKAGIISVSGVRFSKDGEAGEQMIAPEKNLAAMAEALRDLCDQVVQLQLDGAACNKYHESKSLNMAIENATTALADGKKKAAARLNGKIGE
jgi:hypothetical protein